MKHYIFDKEKDDFLRDDGEKLLFNSSGEALKYLKQCEFTDEWIKQNFCTMSPYKILFYEQTPEFNTVDKIDKCLSDKDGVCNLPSGSCLQCSTPKEEAIKELLSLIGDNDDVLRYLEDSAHGLEGKKITEQRAANQSLIAKHKQ